MATVKFIHTADLHLDTPFKGLSSWNPDLAARLKEATFKSFEKIIDLCLKEKVDFLVISGDLFDSENKSLAAQLKLVSGLKRLSDTGIPTYFICGNHDPLDSWLENLQMPEKVFRFDASGVQHLTFHKDGAPLADIYGVSFPEKAINKNLSFGYHLKSDPAPVSIALLHGTVGIADRHENYAPFKVEDVAGKGFDYWALGHIHKRHIVHKASPAIVYPGNPQGRDFGETGAKGCYIVEIDENQPPRLRFEAVQLIRFEEALVDLSGEEKIDKIQEKIEAATTNIYDYQENASYILRIVLTGRTLLHGLINRPGEIEQLREHFNDGQLGLTNFTWIDSIEVKTQPEINLHQLQKGSDFNAEVLKAFEDYEKGPGQLEELIQDITADLTRAEAAKELEKLSGSEKKEILTKAKWILLDHLMKEQE